MRNHRPNTASRQKKTGRFRLGRLLFPLILVTALVAVSATLIDQQQRLNQLRAEESLLIEKYNELETERSRLTHMIDYAGTDAYVEQIARGLLGWVKDGETRYVFEE